ncbi:MAG TPA: DUF4301 family protein [bacterium]|nr:DUF4301 family protein [bacterium]
MNPSWTPDDLAQMRDLGISPGEVERQISLFKDPPPFARLARPAALGDGIRSISGTEKEALLERYGAARDAGRLSKFVPASGAATRMFKTLMGLEAEGATRRADLEKKAEAGDQEALSALLLMDALPQVAFYADLKKAVAAGGGDLDALLRSGDFGPVWRCLLSEEGLGYGSRSKGLIQFHCHRDGPRTALEEHLWEGLRTVKDARGDCRLHFTVSPEHRAEYEGRVKRLAEAIGAREGARFLVDFSEQGKSYQTLAVDLDDRPFRDADGRLLFRPAGHGALLPNLAGLGADIVFIKNIDNVVVEEMLGPTLEWKKLLAGYLLEVQEGVHGHLARLEAGVPGAAAEAAEFIRRTLGAVPPASEEGVRKFLDRPLRVCGVVPNTGEPGGGPFWVRDAEGKESLQIVEGAQVDPDSAEQRAIFRRSTHFNPVDLVCALRGPGGRPYALDPFVDPSAVFISRKSHQGRDLKALELPGLWNGSMAGWITVLLEVPASTFNPVKTVFDLLKPAHGGRS